MATDPPPLASTPLTLLESAGLLGRCRYVELGAFRALGERAPRCTAPVVVAFVAGASLAHGWRAQLLEERLPVSVGLPDAAACTRSPSPELDAVLDAVVADGEDADVLDGLLGGLYPAMAASYAERIAVASPAADPPIVRLLGRLLADLDALRREGAGVAAQLPFPEARRRREVEEQLGRGGGPFGPLRPTAGAARIHPPAGAPGPPS